MGYKPTWRVVTPTKASHHPTHQVTAGWEQPRTAHLGPTHCEPARGIDVQDDELGLRIRLQAFEGCENLRTVLESVEDQFVDVGPAGEGVINLQVASVTKDASDGSGVDLVGCGA